jgi:hypothetical protein
MGRNGQWPDERFEGLSDLGEMRAMLAERVQEWTKAWREEGRQSEAVRLLTRLLERRFSTLPSWVAERVGSADTRQLEDWMERLLEADGLDAVFGKRQ